MGDSSTQGRWVKSNWEINEANSEEVLSNVSIPELKSILAISMMMMMIREGEGASYLYTHTKKKKKKKKG